MTDLITVELQTLTLMNEYGLLESGWTFQYHNGTSRYGYCDSRNKLISISRDHALNDAPSEVLDTIRHEVAHAVSPSYQGSNGRWVRHGAAWHRTFVLMGGSGRTTGLSERDAEQLRMSDNSELPIAAMLRSTTQHNTDGV